MAKSKNKEAADKVEKEAKEKKEGAEHKEDVEAKKEGDEGSDSSTDDGTDGEHKDAGQDVELIKKMLKQYLGDDAESMSDEAQKEMASLGKEAYECHKEMGASHEEAFDSAGKALKLAHHMAKKQSESKKEGSELADKKAVDKKDAVAAKKDGKDADHDDDGSDDTSEKNKESANVKELKTKLLEAEGRIAALESKTKKATVESYVDTKLKESGQPVSITKRFREAAGEIKSEKAFDQAWKVFLEGVKNVRGVEAIDWGVIAEKSVLVETDASSEGSKKLDFSNLAEED